MLQTYVNVACNILLLGCVYFNYRRAVQNYELLCEAQAKERAAQSDLECAQSDLRIHKMKLDLKEKMAAQMRENVHLWRERYHDLWADTHLGELGVEVKDDGRS